MNIYKHIVFNPHMTNLQELCNDMGAQNVYALHSVLPVTEYQWVAVFEAWDGTLKEVDVFGKKPVSEISNKLNPQEIKKLT